MCKDSQLSKSPKCRRQWDKNNGKNLCSVGVVAEIICTEISLKEVIKRGLHKVYKQDTTMEDMGRNVPRIYATLDNKQVEF
jgi:hypothetical protein